MDTQNLNVVAGEALNTDFSLTSVAATDEIYALISIADGTVLYRKASVVAGGSANEISITAGVKCTLKLLGMDTVILPSSGASYILVQNGVDRFGGSISVTGSINPANIGVYDIESYAQKKVFTADGTMPVVIPANSIISRAMLYTDSATLDSGQMALAWGNGGDNITIGSDLMSDETWHLLELEPGEIFTSVDRAVEVRLDGDWTDTQIWVMLFFEVLTA